MIKFIEGYFFFLNCFGLFFMKSGYTGKKKKEKKYSEHVINKEPKLEELIKYEYHSKELNVS